LVELCFSGQFDLQTVKRMLTGGGGIFAYAGTSDMRQLDQRIRDGDEKAGKWVNAMAYTVARQIASMTAALHGRVDAVVLAGAMVSWTRLVDLVRPRIAFIAPILVFPENMEMQALALGALRVIEGKELAQEY
jgi:butyrate kinase